jgi:hypothetical protein
LGRGLFVKSPEKALKQMGIKPYFGPQWWILPDTAIAAILPLYESDTFRNCMKNCYSCDETFFQTAIMVHADQFGITLNEKGYYLNKKWFTIFSGGHPIILTLDNFEQIISSQMLFGRKFNITKDSAILDRLDAYNSIHRSEEILD